MRHVVLTKNEMEELTFIQKHGKSPLERSRSMCLLLSNQKRSMSEVAGIMNLSNSTVVRLLNQWDNSLPNKRLEMLYRVEGQGAKLKLEPIRDKIPELLENSNRNTKLMVEKIEKEHKIKICKTTLQTFLKGARI